MLPRWTDRIVTGEGARHDYYSYLHTSRSAFGAPEISEIWRCGLGEVSVQEGSPGSETTYVASEGWQHLNLADRIKRDERGPEVGLERNGFAAPVAL